MCEYTTNLLLAINSMIPIYCAKHDLTIWLHDAITKVVPIVKVNILILVHVVELTNVLLIIVNVKVTQQPDLTIVKALQENWASANFVNPYMEFGHIVLYLDGYRFY